MPVYAEETIAAIATPPGPGGIGIIRISGPAALAILKTLFLPHREQSEFISHRMYYGWIIDPADNKTPIDEVLVVYMRGPLTYTREDVVEIHCHGSYLVQREILSQTLDAGARLADPGEFTKRAFINGRIDLTRAEAVLELLEAKTRQGLEIALTQLRGGLYDKVEAVKDALLSIRAVLEVAIDFPDDESDILNTDDLRGRIRHDVQPVLEELIATHDKGRIYRDGIAVVILGRPNVGKSSLLNALLREERAIVTTTPGTTRDTIEEYLDINGVPVRIIDTAGIRNAREEAEEIGVRRARQKASEADLVLLLLDGAEGFTEEELALYGNIKDRPVLLVLNKIDIALPNAMDDCRAVFADSPIAAVSAKTHEGMNALEKLIFEMVTGGSSYWDPGHARVPNLRHKDCLVKALAAVRRAADGLDRSLPLDLLAVDVQSALDHLGDIVGETTTDDVLDRIFDSFCIGK